MPEITPLTPLGGHHGASLELFVASLRANATVELPYCWRLHGWIVGRLFALQQWKAKAEQDPRENHEWWAFGVGSLQRDIESHFRPVRREFGLRCRGFDHNPRRQRD